MPVILAMMASAMIHVSVLFADGWALPSLDEPDEMVVSLPAIAPAPELKEAPKQVEKPRPPAPKKKASAPSSAAPAADLALTEAEPAALADAATLSSAEPAPAEPPSDTSSSTSAADIPVALPDLRTALARWPTNGSWRYTITRGEGGLLVGQAHYSWRLDGTQYETQSRTETVGLVALFADATVTQHSRGEIGAQGLMPMRFSYASKKRNDEVVIDRAAGEARSGDRRWPLPAVGASRADAGVSASVSASASDTLALHGVQDLLSMNVHIGLILAASPAGATLPAQIQLPILSGRKLDNYRFELVGEETLERQFEKFATRHVRASHRDDVLDLWFTVDLPVPVRVRVRDRKGDIYDQWLVIPEKGLS
jgi:hypothetical protein